MMKFKALAAAALVLAAGTSMAQTVTLNGTSDNSFTAWLSQDPYLPDGPDINIPLGSSVSPGWNQLIAGTPVGLSGSNPLYVLIKVDNETNVASPAMLAATLTINGAGWVFSNGGTFLGTNTTNWEGITINSAADFVNQVGFGVGSAAPTDTLFVQDPLNSAWTNIPMGADPIWTAAGGNHPGGQAAVFATVISPVTAVPEPSAYAMMIAGLGALTVVARRRKSKAA